MRTITEEQFKKQFGENVYNQFGDTPKKDDGYFQRLGKSFKETSLDIGEGITVPAKKLEAGKEPTSIDFLRAGLRTAGGFSKIALSPVMEAPGIKQGLEFAGEKIAEVPGVKPTLQKYVEWSQKYPEAAKDIENVLDISAFTGIDKVAQTSFQVAKVATKATTNVVGKVAEKGVQIGTKVKGVIAPIAQEAKRLPSRFGTNVAQKQAVQETINKLPSKVARQAAQDGIKIADVNTLYNISKTQKPFLKKLATNIKQFAEGKTKTNPIEVVGKPIVNRIKQLESQRGVIGKKLGKVSESLGNVSKNELDDAVFNELTKVQGLSGLKKTISGVLDFRGTTLATELSKADRAAIEKIYRIAIKGGTGKSKHLLRQELFEILGGKKRSLANLTDTQEKAFLAVRKGLSNVLESKNATYKILSNDYRKVMQPLQDIRGYMKKVLGAEEDIQNMSAGLLARRLTSAAKSNPEIRAVLNAMDKATAIPGKTRVSIESLQDFYNILEKYYDIAPKTGFQAQVRQGVAKGIGGIKEQAMSYLGETPAVRQKALEKMLEEILN